MGKARIRAVGWALGLSMAVVGISIATGKFFITPKEITETEAVEGDELAVCQGTGSGYGTRRTNTDSHSVGWVLSTGQTGYLGANNATNHGKVKPTAADLPVVKGVFGSATTDTTGYYFYYTSTAVSNVGSVTFSTTAHNNASAKPVAYVLSSSTAASNGSTTWSQVSLASGSGLTTQGGSISGTTTYTFQFSTKQTSALYYGFVIKVDAYDRLTEGTIKLLEGEDTREITGVDVKTQPTKNKYLVGESFDPTGLTVTVTYSDASTEDVDYLPERSAKFDFVGFNSSSVADDQKVTVKYAPDGESFYTCSTKVNVDIVTVSAITADVSDVVAEYNVGDKLNLKDLEITFTYSDSSSDSTTITSNDDFAAKGFSLKLSGETFATTTPLTVSHDEASFVVYYGGLYDSVHTIVISVTNAVLININNATTTAFWPEASSYCGRHGVFGNGTQYSAFDGVWYPNSGFQMNKIAAKAHIGNAINSGRIKSVVLSVTTGATLSAQFHMYYGSTAFPENGANTISPSVSGGTWTYDFSEVNASFFNLAKDVTDGNVVISSIAITFAVNDSIDMSEEGAYSDYFLATTEGLCDEDGIENGVSDVWTKLSGVFALLSSSTKASLKSTALEEKGVSDGTTVGNAMARYYWATKNHDANTDFIGGGDIKAAANKALPMDSNENSSAITITIVLAAGFLAAGGFAFMAKRHRKED